MNKHLVLWVEDTPEQLSNFQNDIEEDGQIEFVIFKDSESAVHYLERNIEKLSAAVLDIESFRSSLSEEETKSSFCRVRDCINQLKHKNPIEYFAFTGKGKYLNDQKNFKEEYGCEIFDKKYQSLDAIKFLKEIVDRHIIAKIVNKHKDVFNLSEEIKSDLLGVLLVLENQEWKNSGVFNQIRKILEWVMGYCYNIGLSPIAFSGTNLTECSKFLGNSHMLVFVPLHVQRSLHSAVSISNDGSHRLAIDELVKEGHAPYLIRSTIFELLNVISWLLGFPVDEDSMAERSLKVQTINQMIQQRRE